jgi:calpain-15
LATASAIAEHPDRIKNIFAVQNFNQAGIFGVNLFIRGHPYVETIDTSIPVLENNTPVNARPGSMGAWWPVLLEKAYAKMNLNYANIDGGMPYEAMRALTG